MHDTTPTTRTRRPPRYRIWHEAGAVILTSTDPDVIAAVGKGDETTLRRVYAAYGSWGHVHDITQRPGTLGPQVCDGLGGAGNTLSTTGDLATLIRRELRRALRSWERLYAYGR